MTQAGPLRVSSGSFVATVSVGVSSYKTTVNLGLLEPPQPETGFLKKKSGEMKKRKRCGEKVFGDRV